MALPLIIAAGTALTIGTTFLVWGDILFGKKITILGQRTTGKTTLFNFLMNGEFTDTYEQTVFKKKIKKEMKHKFKHLNLRLKINPNSYDVGGSQDQHGVWKKLSEEANVLIYLFDVNKWMNNPEYLEVEIERDISVIENIIRSKKDLKVILVGTHIDLDSDYINAENKVAYRDDILNEAFIIGMQVRLGGRDRCHITLESFRGEDNLSIATKNILSFL